ncbi:DUF1294 domain-containing protein [Pelotomaculum propionicicum]|uniref:DUF1294 domain-containing protein n=1 Tax=Pelotomaculum propionicicum TaxID=258475 RepID=UPI003B81FC2F
MIIYILAINITGFLIMWYDKAMARARRYRVPESRLLLLAVAGGSVGVYLGMHIFKHKTNKLLFSLGVPAIFVAQIIIFRTLH